MGHLANKVAIQTVVNTRVAQNADTTSRVLANMSGSVGTLGKYQLIREIARSNDIVYEAYDPTMNRRVALKELSMPSGSTDQQREDRRSRFLREARAAGTLTHPNIVTVYEYGEEAGRHFIAMEYLEGHNLRNELDTHGLLPVEKAINITKEVLEALEYAHQHGVIHRDIKPDNIQLLPDGRVKLTDFGIARLTFEPNITMDGQVFGTPSYMSPEQVVGKEIDARSDLFGVGVVLYEMLAGKKPFGGDSVVSITYAIMNNTPEQPPQANWSVWKVVEQAIEKSPQLRFAGSADMRRALEAAEQSTKSVVIDPAPQNQNPYAHYPQQSQPQNVVPPPVLPQGQQGSLPYGQVSPYQQPYAQAPSYTYNPYGAPQPAQPQLPQYPVAAPGPYVPPNPPVYYPPPPRAPLISPEARIFWKKLLIAFVVIGTFFGLVIVLIQASSSIVDKVQKQQADAGMQTKLESLPANASLEQQIDHWEKAAASFQDNANKESANKQLAILIAQRGDAHWKAGRAAEAEADYSRAIELDPANGVILSRRAQVYESMGRQAADPAQRQQYWSQAASLWERAASMERNVDVRKQLIDGAVNAYIALGNEFQQDRQNYSAQQAYRAALDMIDSTHPRYQELRRSIESMN